MYNITEENIDIMYRYNTYTYIWNTKGSLGVKLSQTQDYRQRHEQRHQEELEEMRARVIQEVKVLAYPLVSFFDPAAERAPALADSMPRPPPGPAMASSSRGSGRADRADSPQAPGRTRVSKVPFVSEGQMAKHWIAIQAGRFRKKPA